MKKARKSQSSGNLWLVAGLVILAVSLIWHRHELTKLSFVPNDVVDSTTHRTSKQPSHIDIPSINVNLPIQQTTIHEGIWTVAKNGASHLAYSANPGEKGNIIIYAHNTTDRFGALPSITTGTTITLLSRDGQQHSYIVYRTQIVNPSDVHILEAENDHELTLYTCFGFADMKRFVVKALPKDLNNISLK